MHRVIAVVSLVGDTVEFHFQGIMAGLVGIPADVSDVKVDWGLKKLAADDVARALSAHFNVIATDTPDNPRADAAAPRLSRPDASNIYRRSASQRQTKSTPTSSFVRRRAPGWPRAFRTGLSYAFSGLVADSSSGKGEMLMEFYAVTAVDARTGETFASGMAELHKPSFGKAFPHILCDAGMWRENLPEILGTSRQVLEENFAAMLNASVPLALANAGLISDAEATAQETAAKNFVSCKQPL